MSIKDLEELSQNFFKIVKGRMRLFMLELNLAKYSLLPFLLLAIGCTIIVAVIWLLTLTLMGFLLFYFIHNLVICILGLLLFNLLVGGMVFILLCRYFKQLSFLRTRNKFKTTKPVAAEGVDHDKNQAIKEAN
jgi:uncharacterized membrane protein YqjE